MGAIRLLLATLLMAGTTLLGCPLSPAKAADAAVNRFDIPIRVESACDGDLVVSSGTLQVVSRESSGQVFENITIRTTGVGEVSGAEYVTHVHLTQVTTGPAFEFQAHTNLISKGATTNTVIDLHLAIDEFGNVVLLEVKARCVG